MEKYWERTDGEYSRTSKLTNDIVYAIREEYDRGLRGEENAERFGVQPAHYNLIGRRERWRNLPERGE